jgi:hypothetical protein
MKTSSIKTAAGGTIVFTATGMIHYANSSYTGKIAVQEAKQKVSKK